MKANLDLDFKPRQNYVLVELFEKEENHGGIVNPDSKGKPSVQGKVIDHGVPHAALNGKIVLLKRLNSYAFELKGKRVAIVHNDDILGVFSGGN